MHSLILITAMTATTGLFGGKHCGAKPRHHARQTVSATSCGAPVGSSCGASYASPMTASYGASPVASYPASPQAAYPTPAAPAMMAPAPPAPTPGF